VSSGPAIFYSASMQPGVLLVADDQVRSEPVAVDPAAIPGLGYRFRTTVAGAVGAAPGALIASSGALPISGRVVSAAPNAAIASDTDVVYELVGPTQLFREVGVSIRLNPTQARALMVVQPGRRTIASADRLRRLGLTGAPCTGDAPTLAALTGEFEGKVDPSLSTELDFFIFNGAIDQFKVRATGSMEVTGKAVVNLGASVSGGVSCKVTLGYIPIPLTGPLTPLIAPIIPLDAKLDLSAQVSVNAFSLSAEVKQRTDADFGLFYKASEPPAGQWQVFKSLQAGEPEFNRNVSFPQSASVRVKANAFVGLTSGIALGGVLARLEVIEVSAGPELEAKFGGSYDVATDTVYTAEYELKGKAGIGPGKHIQQFFERWLLSEKALDLSLKVEKSIARTASPTKLTVDKPRWQAGEKLTFAVELDPKTVNFPVVGYNVSEVCIYRLDYEPVYQAVQVATASAAANQTIFGMEWTADRAGEAQDATRRPTFYAFVVDKALSAISGSFPFELGRVRDLRPTPLATVAANGAAAYAIRGGVLQSIGKNFGGALGAGLQRDIAAGPVTVPLNKVRAVSGEAWHATALLEDGSVWQWGWGADILPIGGNAEFNPLPLPVDRGDGQPMNDVKSISSNYWTTAALRNDGSVWIWGRFDSVQKVSSGVPNVAAIAMGGDHVMMLTEDGQVWVRGNNKSGQLGLGDYQSRNSAMPVPGMDDVVAIAAGGSHSLAVKSDGSLWAWGDNFYGALGVGSGVAISNVPLRVNLSGVTRISAGLRHSQAVADRVAYVWGSNDNGQSGSCAIDVPTWAPLQIASGVVDVDGGEFSALVVLAGGGVSYIGTIPGLSGGCTLKSLGLSTD
jgi:Regulator of chromosome condensation (RCC1) repeat